MQNNEEPRNFLDEARSILSGKSLLMAQREHLVALKNYCDSEIEDIKDSLGLIDASDSDRMVEQGGRL